MSDFVVFDITGKIIRIGTCPTNMVSLQCGSGESVLEEPANDATMFVDTYDYFKVKPKPSIQAVPNKLTILSDSTDSVIISPLPIPTVVSVDRNSYEVLDGIFEFTTNLVGVYKIRAESFPYLSKEWEVTAI